MSDVHVTFVIARRPKADEAIQCAARLALGLDCFVAALLAMTI